MSVEPAPPSPGGGLVRLRIDLGYDGTGFSGWARQPALRTVQGELESACALLLQLDPPPTLTCAGRTDAGVHASGQVAHVDIPESCLTGEDPLATLARRLRRVLPDDIRVTRVVRAPAGFDARFSALDRRYAYAVSDDPSGVDPLLRHRVVHHPRLLDLDAMNLAGHQLLGEHDFAAFCRPRPGATTIRTLQHLHWERQSDGVAVMAIVADAFCHSMVRTVVGALLPVGDHRRDPQWPAEVLRAQQRHSAVAVAPAYGLVLMEVRYPPDAELAARQERTRMVRSLAVGDAAGEC